LARLVRGVAEDGRGGGIPQHDPAGLRVGDDHRVADVLEEQPNAEVAREHQGLPPVGATDPITIARPPAWHRRRSRPPAIAGPCRAPPPRRATVTTVARRAAAGRTGRGSLRPLAPPHRRGTTPRRCRPMRPPRL